MTNGIVQKWSSQPKHHDLLGTRSDPEPFDWYAVCFPHLIVGILGADSSSSQLTPSNNITWTDCFGDQKCGRLNLPLDYARPEGPKTQIAIQMKPATDPANYRGVFYYFYAEDPNV
jgi:hypothetical protein